MNKIKIAGIIVVVAVWLRQKRIVAIWQERDRYLLNNGAIILDMSKL